MVEETTCNEEEVEMDILKATGVALAIGFGVIAVGGRARAAVTPPQPVILYDQKQFAGHNCFSWLGPQTATDSSAVYNQSRTSFDTMYVDCPITHDMFYGTNPPGASGGSHGGIKDAYVRWIKNAPSVESMQCTLKAVRGNSSGGFSTFTFGTVSPFATLAWQATQIPGSDGNFDQYNYYLSCQLPPFNTATNKASYLMNYGVTEQGLP